MSFIIDSSSTILKLFTHLIARKKLEVLKGINKKYDKHGNIDTEN